MPSTRAYDDWMRDTGGKIQDEILRRIIRNAFDAGFSAGVKWRNDQESASDTHGRES